MLQSSLTHEKVRQKITKRVDRLHCAFLQITDRYDVVYLPKLNVTKCNQSGKLPGCIKNRLSLLRHADLFKKLASRRAKRGLAFVEVNEAYSTKWMTCCEGGYMGGGVGGSKRLQCSKCGYSVDRDVNGARNILILALTRTLAVLEERIALVVGGGGEGYAGDSGVREGLAGEGGDGVSGEGSNGGVPKSNSVIKPTHANAIRLLVVNGMQNGKPLAPLIKFGNRFELIREVDLSGMYIFNAAITPSLEMLLLNCRNLQSLDLSNCLWLTDENLINLINCTRLQKLILRGCGALNGSTLNLLLENLYHLSHLSLFGCTKIEQLGPIFSENMVAPLKSVDLCSMYGLSDIDTAVSNLLRKCGSTLESLNAGNMFITSAAFIPARDIQPPMRLLSLSLEGASQLSSQALDILEPHVTELESLNLLQCRMLQGVKLENFFYQTTRLKRVNLAHVEHASDDVLGSLGLGPGECLEDVTLMGCWGVSDVGIGWLVQSCPNLVVVKVDYTRVTAAGVEGLVMRCGKLRFVSASGCEGVTGTRVHEVSNELRAARLRLAEEAQEANGGDRRRPVMLGPDTVEFDGRNEVEELRRRIA
ncbi:hypothetical protein HDV05_001525 [Chytridiales sp. JEL 0842]|nr:hypothetical protein HDV05_001525 [Chytridiales sp. JEL 0842]